MIRRTVFQNSGVLNDKGVTLVEVMISLVILLIVFMGLIQASILSIDHNMRNKVRDEAVRIAAETVNQLRGRGYDDPLLALAPPASNIPFPGQVPDGSAVTNRTGNYSQTYNVAKTVQTLSDTTKQLTITVTYTYKDDPQVVYSVNATVRK